MAFAYFFFPPPPPPFIPLILPTSTILPTTTEEIREEIPQSFSFVEFTANNNITEQLDLKTLSNGTISQVGFRCPPSIKDYGEEYRMHRYVIDVYLLPIIIAFGLFGNIMSFSILGEMRHVPATEVLRSLAITDSIYLLNCFCFQTLETLYIWNNPSARLLWFLPYLKGRIVWPLANTIQTMGVWLILLVTSERYYAITKPLAAKTILTRRRNRIWIMLIVMLAFTFNLPTNFELRVRALPEKCTKVRPLEAMPVTAMLTNFHYNLLYKTLACLLCRSIGPVFVLIILNAKLVREIQKSKSDCLQTKRQSGGAQSHHMSEIVALIVGMFILCQLPDVTFRILRTIKTYNVNFIVDWLHFAYIATISNMFVTINSAINFLLYCVSGRRFRQLLAQRVSKSRRHFSSKYIPSQTLSTPLSTYKVDSPKVPQKLNKTGLSGYPGKYMSRN